MDCQFIITECEGRKCFNIATCQVCGFQMEVQEKDPTRIHSECGKAKNIQPKKEDEIKIKIEKTKPPKVITKVKNFTKAAIKHIIAGMPTCTQEQIDERHAICTQCPLFKRSDNNSSVGVCNECGCNITKEVQYLNKLAMADQECPKGKWPKLA